MKIKDTAILLVHWTWCSPQSMLGLLVFCYVLLRDTSWTCFFRNGTVFIRTDALGAGLSLGFFIFSYRYDRHSCGRAASAMQERMDRHEWGHSLQGFLLGPLYLFVIGIPSAVWFQIHRKRGGQYFRFYTERWADIWGKVVRTTG